MAGTLLLVDDNESNLAGLQAGFGKSGYEVLTAGGGSAAADTISSRGVDVVVTDLRMPDVDGMSVLSTAQAAKPRSYTTYRREIRRRTIVRPSPFGMPYLFGR